MVHSLIFNSSGTIDYYRIDAIEQVDCTTGSIISLVYSEANITGIHSTPFGFNSLVINGSTGYFQNQLGNCFKVTATVGNACGEVTDFSYMKINGVYKTSAVTNLEATEPSRAFAAVYPNPATDQVAIAYQLEAPAAVTTTLRDPSGRIVLQTLTATQAMGQHQQSLDVSSLPHGIYIYQIEAGDQIKTGRLAKM